MINGLSEWKRERSYNPGQTNRNGKWDIVRERACLWPVQMENLSSFA
jgi:hypothetical protein